MTAPADEEPRRPAAPPEPLLVRRRPGPGRRPALTEETAQRIVSVLRAGNYLKVAAQAAGVGESTLRGWLARGRAAAAEEELHADDPEWVLPEAEERYVAFLEVVTQAETAAEVSAVVAWRSAFRDDWRAARDYLVRRRPDRWAATVRVNMTTEEAERRVEQAALQVLTDLGVDVQGEGEPEVEGLGEFDDLSDPGND